MTEPIPLRFVLLYDPAVDDTTKIGSFLEFAKECGDAAEFTNVEPGIYTAWNECAAQKLTDYTNGLYAQLLGSTAPLLKFHSYTTQPNAELARGQLAKDLPSLLEGSILPGTITAVVVMEIADQGGIALMRQPLPSAGGGVLAVVAAENGARTLAHELGHAMGFPHVAGAEVPAVASYPCCGGMEVATAQGACMTASNIMCSGRGSTLDDCQHGAFLKKILTCWLSGQGGIDCEGAN